MTQTQFSNCKTIEDKIDVTREGALAAFNAIRLKAEQDGLTEMTLDEINEEIDKVRRSE